MTVECQVFVDGSLTGTHYTFEAVPRQGDKIQIGPDQKNQTLTVQSVVFVAAGVHDIELGIQITASKTTLGNA